MQDALRALEMPRFTRRYPAILETLMKQMLNMVHVSAYRYAGRHPCSCMLGTWVKRVPTLQLLKLSLRTPRCRAFFVLATMHPQHDVPK